MCQSDPPKALGARDGAVIALVALGANLGQPLAMLRQAVGWLRARAAGELRCSAVYRSTPFDCPPGSPDFLNAAVAFPTAAEETPESLLGFLQACEARAGRPPQRERNSPRALDLDLILFGAETRATAALWLPHPRARSRAFVLAPAADVAASAVWPGTTATVADCLDELLADPAAREEWPTVLESTL